MGGVWGVWGVRGGWGVGWVGEGGGGVGVWTVEEANQITIAEAGAIPPLVNMLSASTEKSQVSVRCVSDCILRADGTGLGKGWSGLL